MGYSIAAEARNVLLRDAMLAFMKRHYRNAPDVFGYEGGQYASNPETDLDYSHGDKLIGFDYNACDPEREYIFCVTRWMAIQISPRIYSFHNGTYDFDLDLPYAKIPYYLYDEEKVPIMFERHPKCHDAVRDKFGCDIEPSEMRLRSMGLFYADEKEGQISSGRKVYETIRSEIKRLNDLWKKRKIKLYDADGAKLLTYATALRAKKNFVDLETSEGNIIRLAKDSGKPMSHPFGSAMGGDRWVGDPEKLAEIYSDLVEEYSDK